MLDHGHFGRGFDVPSGTALQKQWDRSYNTFSMFGLLQNNVRLDRKRKGIVPNMPPLAERPGMKEEYLAKFKNK